MHATSGTGVRAALLDVQGTLLSADGAPYPGAVRAVKALKRQGLAVRFVTNIDSVPVADVARRLRSAGIPVSRAEVVTPVSAALHFLERQSRARCHLLVAPPVEPEFRSLVSENGHADYVVVGDCREGFTYERLNVALRLLLSGAQLVALQKGRTFQSDEGQTLDTGAFVAALEWGSGQQATVLGKPSTELLRVALEGVGCDPYEAVMVGDDVGSDVAGAHAAGMRSVLVHTGRFSLRSLERSEVKPDLVIDSVADLPDALEELRTA